MSQQLLCTFEVSAADVEARTIEGMGVPWDEVGNVSPLGPIAFARGSLQPARTRTPLLLGHDGEPVGVLVELADTDTGARVRFKVDATPEGDRALTQAASGSRGAISIGADVDRVSAQDGHTRIDSARFVHFALVPHGAFVGAEVERVAAERSDDDDDAGDAGDDQPPAEPAEPEEGDEMGEQQSIPEGPGGAEVEARLPAIRVTGERARRELSAGEFVALSIKAQMGDQVAARRVEAALVESISTDVSGLLPPQYETTVIGRREIDRPLWMAFRGRPLPGVGLQIVKPKWVTHTAGAEAANVDADATSTKVTLSTQTAAVVRWDWAGAIPWVVVQRSEPSVIDEIFADAVQGFYLYVEGKVAGQLNTAAAGVSTTIGAALAEFYIATGKQRTAEVICMAPDVWGKFVDKSMLASSILVGPVSAAGGLSMNLGGLPVVVSGTLAVGETILATRRAIDCRITEPVRLTANAIGALNVELAVVGEGLYDTDYPAELLKFAAIVPAVAEATTRSKA